MDRQQLLNSLGEEIHEVADGAINPTGYADAEGEADLRSAWRDRMETEIRATVNRVLDEMREARNV